ncbi:MAG TPA: NnrS family protein, partial [Pseudobdellovibrionaceae bacterium]|nr:NnrS family protein [Pseudobdellovibrionaceae bacterium]
MWFFFKMRWISFFPGPAHGHLMFSAFLWPFIAGFLMTAIPRMTNSAETHFFELFLSLLFVFLQWVLNLRNLISYSEGLYFFQILFLGIFVLRRILPTRSMPFEGFVFIPFAFFITIFILLSPYFLLDFDSTNVMRLSGEAFVLNLIIGLGSRLVPILSRVPSTPNPSPRLSSTKLKWLVVTALLLNVSFLLELF